MNHSEKISADEKDLYQAILHLKTVEECYIFFKDLCTPAEISAMTERWKLAKLLDNEQEKLSYREIADKTKASIATIGRVARFLKIENYQGYRLILDRMQKKKKS
ncbi:MAG: hypothetical protein C5B43_04790 [Verrucomicrobia bacterium]|nr:MAG: hypothetical protein C5B43_04790 [Verrucomicrobiota bacterium]